MDQVSDGISNPVVNGFDTVINPGPKPVDTGVLIAGDPVLGMRVPRTCDGSFLVFRWLFHLVPESNNLLNENTILKDGNGNDLTQEEEGSELLGGANGRTLEERWHLLT